MNKFNFSTPTSAANTGFAFGASAPGFGAQQAPATNLSFAPGLSATTQPSLTFGSGGFGAANAAPGYAATGVAPVFGAAGAAPAFGATGSAPAFGGTAAVPAFGATATAPAFGAAAALPAFAATSTAQTFGTINTAPAFGATAAAPGFGATVPGFGATAAAPAFGATAAVPAFGATAAAAAPAFGATAATPAYGATTVAPTFGTTTAAPAFGATTQALTYGAASTVPTFGTSTITQGLTGFAQPTSAAGLPPLFGAASTGATITQPTLTLGGAPTTSAAVAPSVGFNFSAPATTSGGLNFGAATAITSTAAPTSTSGFFGAKTTASSFSTLNAAPTFGVASTSTTGSLLGANLAAAPTTTATAKMGLGGIDVNAAQPKTIEGRSESAKIKEAQLPQEIVATVHSLQQQIDQQKSISSDIARKTKNVSDELQSLNWSLAEISNSVENNFAAVKQLKTETTVAVRQAEMAQRTQQTPPGLQFENTAPLQYFMELIQKYEADMITFRNQVELTEKHMRSLANPQSFTAEDLKRGLHEIHESFIALAGRLHETHQKVEQQKEQYLNLRKHLLKDTTNVFAEDDQASAGATTAAKSTTVPFGPTPFSAVLNMNLMNRNAGSWPTAQIAQKTDSIFGIGTNGSIIGGSIISGQSAFGNIGTNTSAFGTAFAPTTNLTIGNDGGSFNLQKPPAGAKRNKH